MSGEWRVASGESSAREIAGCLIHFFVFRCALIALLIATAFALGFGRRSPVEIGTPTAIEAKHHAYSRGHSGNYTAWVQETITLASLDGAAPRESFVSDPSQPKEFRWQRSDYAGSPWDVGHLAGAANARMSRLRERETFLITNTMPQSAALNRGQWNALEESIRARVRTARQMAVVITGPAFLPGRGDRVRIDTLAGGKIWIPTHCWKAVAFLRRDGAPQELRAWLIPNRGVDDYHKFAISVDALETAIGLDLFPGIDEALEAK